MNRSRLTALSVGAILLVASVLVPATALAAGSGSISLAPSTVNTTTGNTFTVDITTSASVPLSGASASLNFDRTKVQIVSVAAPAAGTGWNVSGIGYVLPTIADISTANSSGHLKATGAFFTNGTGSVTGSTQVLTRVTFFATASGSSNLTLPTSGTDPAELIDGTSGTAYGTTVAVSATGATVTTTGAASVGTTVTTNVTGTVDAGYVALTCPTSITVPLVRNVNNFTDFTCSIGSNTTWTLSVVDLNTDANHGYLVDAAQGIRLHDPAFVRFNKHVVSDASGNPSTVYDTSVDLHASPSAQTVAVSQNNVAAPLTFTQMAEPNDVAGSYAMSLRFTVVSSF